MKTLRIDTLATFVLLLAVVPAHDVELDLPQTVEAELVLPAAAVVPFLPLEDATESDRAAGLRRYRLPPRRQRFTVPLS